jgi:hypothetical protein
MTTKTDALKLALHDIERYQIKRQDFDSFENTLIKIKEALAQPEQEPNATRPCRSCSGTGLRDTGIDESPTTICKPCDGTGQIDIAAQPAVPEGHKQEPAVPEGWKSVPIQPTLAMINALADTDPEHESVWEAVLAAAPQREWVGLTFDEKYDLAHHGTDPYEVVIDVEAKLKELNN